VRGEEELKERFFGRAGRNGKGGVGGKNHRRSSVHRDRHGLKECKVGAKGAVTAKRARDVAPGVLRNGV